MKFCGQVANKSADKILVGLRTINLAFADKFVLNYADKLCKSSNDFCIQLIFHLRTQIADKI